MVQGDATQYYRKRNGIMVEHMVRPANFDMRYNLSLIHISEPTRPY